MADVPFSMAPTANVHDPTTHRKEKRNTPTRRGNNVYTKVGLVSGDWCCNGGWYLGVIIMFFPF